MSVAVDVEPLQTGIEVLRLEPTIGAEIQGVDLSRPIDDVTRDAIKAAVLEHKVVFFRDQDLTREQHEAFAARFGPLYAHPEARRPELARSAVHRIAAEDNKVYDDLRAQQDPGWDPYHTDTSWRLVPTWGAVLRAVNVPEVGGDTVWVDAGLAYERLPQDVKDRLVGLHVAHDYRPALNRAGLDYPIVAHPIVKVHRETERPILWVDFTKNPTILGLDRSENAEVLELVLEQYRRPELQVRFHWRPGSVAFWDNRAAVHYAVKNYGDFPRLLERVLIADDPQWADL